MQVIRLDSETVRLQHADGCRDIYLGQNVLDFKHFNEFLLFRNDDHALFLNRGSLVRKIEEAVGEYDIVDGILCYQQHNVLQFIEFNDALRMTRRTPIFLPFAEPLLCVDAQFGQFCIRRGTELLCFFKDIYVRGNVMPGLRRCGFYRDIFWMEDEKGYRTELGPKRQE